MAKVLIMGASSGIGFEATRQALEHGHDAVAFSRNVSRLALSHPKLKLMPGNALKPQDVRQALDGVDAVIQALGIRLTAKSILFPVSLFSASTRVLITEMEHFGVRRLLAVTGLGTGESRAALPAPARPAFDLVLGRAYDDKGYQERLIANSELNWTIVRPGILTKGSHTGRYEVFVDPSDWRPGCISRADVADFLLRNMTNPLFSRKAAALVY